MPRKVPEWIGKTDDTAAPLRVRVRVFEREGGKCGQCARKIAAGDTWTLEHLVALINGGQNRESNLGVTCNWCLPEKNAADVAEKSTVARKKAKSIGAAKSPARREKPRYVRKLNGQTVRRDETTGKMA